MRLQGACKQNNVFLKNYKLQKMLLIKTKMSKFKLQIKRLLSQKSKRTDHNFEAKFVVPTEKYAKFHFQAPKWNTYVQMDNIKEGINFKHRTSSMPHLSQTKRGDFKPQWKNKNGHLRRAIDFILGPTFIRHFNINNFDFLSFYDT